MDRNYFNFTFTLNPQLLLLCTLRDTLQYQPHNALLNLYSPWHSALSHPQWFTYSVLIVALCSVTPTMLCLLCTHRGTLQCHTHNALLTLYSPWHSALSQPQCFAYSVLTVALCSITPTMLCMPVKKIASGQASVGVRVPNPVVCWFSMLNRKHDVKLYRSVTQGIHSLEFCVNNVKNCEWENGGGEWTCLCRTM